MEGCLSKITTQCICTRMLICAKYTLSVLNCFVMVIGVCMVVIAVISMSEESLIPARDDPPPDPAIFMLVLGMLMSAVGVFGCVAPLRDNVLILRCFSGFAMLMFILEVVGGVLTFLYLQAVHRSVSSYLMRAIVAYEDDDTQRDVINYVQKLYNCCGAEGYDDWEKNVYYACVSLSHTRCSVPSSCCKVRNNAQCGFQTRGFGEAYAAHSIYTQGCVHAIVAEIREHFVIIGVLALGVGFIELLGLIVTGMLVRNILMAKSIAESNAARHSQTVVKPGSPHEEEMVPLGGSHPENDHLSKPHENQNTKLPVSKSIQNGTARNCIYMNGSGKFLVRNESEVSLAIDGHMTLEVHPKTDVSSVNRTTVIGDSNHVNNMSEQYEYHVS